MEWIRQEEITGDRRSKEVMRSFRILELFCRLKRRLLRLCFHSHEYIIAFPLFALRDTGKLNSDMQQTHTTTNAVALIYNGQLATAGL